MGVATLGFFIDSAIADFRLDKMFLLLLVPAFLNIAIDIISKKSRDYLKVDKPSDIKPLLSSITDEKWNEMSKNCLKWYEENCSVKGSFDTTIKIINEI